MTNTTTTMNENLSIVKLSNKRLYRSDKKGYVLLNGHFLEVKGFGLVRFADGNEVKLNKSKMNTIQRIIEIPLFELQTEKARNMDISISSCCCICGNKIKEGAKSKQVQLLTNGNIVSTDQDIENSQGFFPVGSECLKKLVIQFSF